jgi:hypothetical protein
MRFASDHTHGSSPCTTMHSRVPPPPEREVDRLIARFSGDEQDVSSEVYLVGTDDGRRTPWAGWRYLALALVIAGAAAALLVTDLGSGGGRSGTTSAALAGAPASKCVRAPGYGGLGARLSAFDPNNNNSTGPAGPSPGAAFYTLTATARGCVTGFAVQDGTTPPLTARDLLILVSHPYLPADAERVVTTDSCGVWRSSALKRATGRAYARATAIAQAGSTPGTAEIAATSSSRC